MSIKDIAHRVIELLKLPEIEETLLLLAAVFSVLLLGTLGYVAIEDGWSFFDAFYMTVITLTTVGFQEVHPLSDEGRLFTVFMIAFGVGVAMVVLTSLASKILEQQISWIVKRGTMQKKIANISGHTIFCGYGRLSQIAIAKLQAKGVPLVVIDCGEEAVEAAEQEGLYVVRGDATKDDILCLAGVVRAKRLVSLLPKDADNLYVVLAAKEFNPEIFMVTRAEFSEGEKRLRQAGADRIISPYRVGGLKIADGLLRPHVTDFLDLAVYSAEGDLQIEEILVPANSPLAGKMLREAFMRDLTNVIIAAIVSPSGNTQFNPSGDSLIEPGATLIGLGLKQEFASLEQRLLGEDKLDQV